MGHTKELTLPDSTLPYMAIPTAHHLEAVPFTEKPHLVFPAAPPSPFPRKFPGGRDQREGRKVIHVQAKCVIALAGADGLENPE